MKRNRRDNMRRERIIMVTSSVFVLTALTMTGLYMKGQEMKQLEDGYTLDFAALENNTGTKLDKIGAEQAKSQSNKANIESDLDYTPIEEEDATQVDSGVIEIPGLTGASQSAPVDQTTTASGKQRESQSDSTDNTGRSEQNPTQDSSQNKGDQAAVPANMELHYSEDQGLTKPVNGDVLMSYKMDGSVYFATLDQYKYNPATLFSAEVGSEVYACAEGKIIEVFETAELGKGITMELGDGYTVTYGQLDEIEVVEGEFVQAGERLGTVAAPSRYYVQEGTNLYFCMEKDNKPMNAEQLF